MKVRVYTSLTAYRDGLAEELVANHLAPTQVIASKSDWSYTVFYEKESIEVQERRRRQWGSP